jgi:hypothetical protein
VAGGVHGERDSPRWSPLAKDCRGIMPPCRSGTGLEQRTGRTTIRWPEDAQTRMYGRAASASVVAVSAIRMRRSWCRRDPTTGRTPGRSVLAPHPPPGDRRGSPETEPGDHGQSPWRQAGEAGGLTRRGEELSDVFTVEGAEPIPQVQIWISIAKGGACNAGGLFFRMSSTERGWSDLAVRVETRLITQGNGSCRGTRAKSAPVLDHCDVRDSKQPQKPIEMSRCHRLKCPASDHDAERLR